MPIPKFAILYCIKGPAVPGKKNIIVQYFCELFNWINTRVKRDLKSWEIGTEKFRTSVQYIATCLFTRLESLAWSQQSFWQLSFWRKRNLWRPCFVGRTKVKSPCIASMPKKKSGNKTIFHPFSFWILHLPSREAMNRSTTQFRRTKQRLPKLHFLQKLGCQNPAGTRLAQGH